MNFASSIEGSYFVVSWPKGLNDWAVHCLTLGLESLCISKETFQDLLFSLQWRIFP